MKKRNKIILGLVTVITLVVTFTTTASAYTYGGTSGTYLEYPLLYSQAPFNYARMYNDSAYYGFNEESAYPLPVDFDVTGTNILTSDERGFLERITIDFKDIINTGGEYPYENEISRYNLELVVVDDLNTEPFGWYFALADGFYDANSDKDTHASYYAMYKDIPTIYMLNVDSDSLDAHCVVEGNLIVDRDNSDNSNHFRIPFSVEYYVPYGFDVDIGEDTYHTYKFDLEHILIDATGIDLDNYTYIYLEGVTIEFPYELDANYFQGFVYHTEALLGYNGYENMPQAMYTLMNSVNVEDAYIYYDWLTEPLTAFLDTPLVLDITVRQLLSAVLGAYILKAFLNFFAGG